MKTNTPCTLRPHILQAIKAYSQPQAQPLNKEGCATVRQAETAWAWITACIYGACLLGAVGLFYWAFHLKH